MPRKRTEMNGSPTGEADNKRKKARFTVYVNEDGSPDTAHLSAEQRETFRRAQGGAQSAPNAPPPSEPAAEPGPPPEPINPVIIGMALNLLTAIEAAIVGKQLGLPVPLVHKCLEPKPPVDGLIVEAMTRVANKYNTNLGPYQDEIMLVGAIGVWQIQAFTQLREIAASMKAQTDAPGQHTPPPPPPPPEASKAEPEAKPKGPAEVVPIDMLLGAHAATGF